MHKREEDRDKSQGSKGCEQQAADDGSTQRSILLAAIAESQRHRHHADHHRESRHDDRTEACETGRERCVD